MLAMLAAWLFVVVHKPLTVHCVADPWSAMIELVRLLTTAVSDDIARVISESSELCTDCNSVLCVFDDVVRSAIEPIMAVSDCALVVPKLNKKSPASTTWYVVRRS